MTVTSKLAARAMAALLTLAVPLLAQQAGIGTNIVGGTGTAGYIPTWTASNKLGNSVMYQSGGNVGVGTATPEAPLDVSGNINFSGNLLFGESAL